MGVVDNQLTFFTADEKFAFARNDATKAVHYQDKYYLEASFPLDDQKPIQSGMYVGYFNRDGKFNMFIVNKPSTNYAKKTVSFTAELAAMVELREESIIEDRRPSNCQAGLAVSVAIEGTIWELGTVEDTIIASNHFYYQNPWSALNEIAERYSCGFDFRVEVSDDGIVGRYVDVVQDIGIDVGLRLEIEKNLDDTNIDIDDTEVRTALYGRGKGLEVGTNSNGDATYGRRINFGDIVWSKENGDPCDKPAGQEWVEDIDATALYGRNGRKRIGVVVFDDCDDCDELIQKTWDYLQSIKQPSVTVKATVRYLEDNFGYKGEAIRLGDYATVIINDTMHVRARVTSAEVDLVNEKKTNLVIGNSVISITDLYASNSDKIDENTEKIDIGSQIAARNPELYQGILNTMVTQIISTGTNMYTDPNDGSPVYVADDGLSALKITGRGILISDQKRGDEFVWTTAIDGTGMTADVVRTGTLKASLVKILGTDMFYWDSQAIFIFDEEDKEKNRQIRIGKYDGVHYGIGYTQDGGQTWQSAIGFNGTVLGTGVVTKENLSKDVIESIKSMRGIVQIEEFYLASCESSGVTASTEGWTNSVQAPSAEKPYLWNREVITYSDDSVFESEPVIIGTFGKSGTDGQTLYTWVKYADTPASGMSDIPDGKTYIGLAYNKTSSKESTDYSEYSWSLIKGADGVDGAPGNDGKTYYTWIKYADDYSGNGISDDPTGKTYIGLAYNKETKTESSSPSDYTWSLFKGSDGVPGKDGKTYYTWIKYADSPTSGMSDIPEGKSYIGLAYNKTNQSESTDYSDYTWSLIKGEKGENGADGKDGTNGTTYYTWVKYADDENGSGISDDPTGKFYIGIAYNKDSSTASTSPADYSWSLFRGSDGVNGENGSDGIGISGISNMYGLSSSTSTQPTDWYEQVPADQEGMLYLWMYEVISYTDGTSTRTEPRITGYLGSESITISQSEPVSPSQDMLWLDTSVSPAVLRRYDTTDGWQECSVSRAELDNITKRISDHDAKFMIQDEMISAKVSQTDYAQGMAGKANVSDVEAQFNAAAELTAKNLALKFSEAKSYTDSKTSSFDSFVEEVMTYFEFGTIGLIIGKLGSSFKTQFTNEKLSFLQGDEEVAFIQYNRMYITEARITDRLSIGTEDNGYFDFVTLSDGLGLKWR